MSPGRSLRRKMVFGSLMWALGVAGVAVAIANTIFHRHPYWAGILHSAILTAVAVTLLIAGLVYVGSGLSPLNALREKLARVREGRAKRVEGAYPAEVQPLVDDLNDLLANREAHVERALARAGDLAHGLKTPLAVLAQEADRADAAGHHELAQVIGQQVERMRRQVEYHLARARAAATDRTTEPLSLAEPIQALVRVMQRLYADRGISIDTQVASAHAVKIRREDLDEILGNVVDNACKWAKARVAIASEQRDTQMIITVDDDGPGLAAEMRDAVLQRGVRADEAAPGSGLGLAIVRDLVELSGGSIRLDQSPLGGLRVTISF